MSTTQTILIWVARIDLALCEAFAVCKPILPFAVMLIGKIVIQRFFRGYRK